MSAQNPLQTGGGLEEELVAARTEAAVADVSAYGHFTLGGKDGPRFLQGLTTNDVVTLAEGKGCYTAFLNVHGRFETDCQVFRIGELLVLQTPPEGAAWLATSLGRFRRAGDFRFEELSGSHRAIAVVGPRGRDLLSSVLERDLGGFGPRDGLEVHWAGTRLWLIGVPRATVWSVDVLGETGAVEELRSRLLADPGTRPAGAEALDRLRIEAGIPRFGRDFDRDSVLQEIDVPEIVSFSKGCYLGQEVVARLHYLGQPAKLIRRLVVDAGLPEPGDAVVPAEGDTDRELGRITSVAPGPEPVVLATVKRKVYAPGTRVRVRRGDDLIIATVAPLSGADAEEAP